MVHELNIHKLCRSCKGSFSSVQFSSVAQWCPIFVTPWTAAHQASLSITNSHSLLKLVFTESVMPSNHLILCHPLLLPPSISPSIRLFSNESVPHIRGPRTYLLIAEIFPFTMWKLRLREVRVWLPRVHGGESLSEEQSPALWPPADLNAHTLCTEWRCQNNPVTLTSGFQPSRVSWDI